MENFQISIVKGPEDIERIHWASKRERIHCAAKRQRNRCCHKETKTIKFHSK